MTKLEHYIKEKKQELYDIHKEFIENEFDTTYETPEELYNEVSDTNYEDWEDISWCVGYIQGLSECKE